MLNVVKVEAYLFCFLCSADLNISPNDGWCALCRQGGPLFHTRLQLSIPPIRRPPAQHQGAGQVAGQVKEAARRSKEGPRAGSRWRGWDSRLQSSLAYWQKRFPAAERGPMR